MDLDQGLHAYTCGAAKHDPTATFIFKGKLAGIDCRFLFDTGADKYTLTLSSLRLTVFCCMLPNHIWLQQLAVTRYMLLKL